jgi:hypothetical protein
MHELIKKVLEVHGVDAFESIEKLELVAVELGYTREDVAAAFDGFDGWPLSDEDLDHIAGGAGISPPPGYMINGTDLPHF